MDTIRHYASFPATGVSLRQMVQFGDRPSTGMYTAVCLFKQCPASIRAFQENSSAADLMISFPIQELSFVLHSSSLRNSPSAWRIAFRTSVNFPTGSVRCPLSKRSRTGTRNHSRYDSSSWRSPHFLPASFLTMTTGNHHSASTNSHPRSESPLVAPREGQRWGIQNSLGNHPKPQYQGRSVSVFAQLDVSPQWERESRGCGCAEILRPVR